MLDVDREKLIEALKRCIQVYTCGSLDEWETRHAKEMIEQLTNGELCALVLEMVCDLCEKPVADSIVQELKREYGHTPYLSMDRLAFINATSGNRVVDVTVFDEE
jgi:hypothetical protein